MELIRKERHLVSFATEGALLPQHNQLLQPSHQKQKTNRLFCIVPIRNAFCIQFRVECHLSDF